MYWEQDKLVGACRVPVCDTLFFSIFDFHLSYHIGTGGTLWPGTVHLARWIVKHPDFFYNKSVLELGCGASALPGMTAALFARWAT